MKKIHKGIATKFDWIVVKEYRRFMALRAKHQSIDVDIDTRGYEFWTKEQDAIFERACKKVGKYKNYIALAIQDSEERLKRLTKKVTHRNSWYLNNIISIFNNGCKCLPVEDDTFFELPKCMEHILMPLTDHATPVSDISNEPDYLWLEANKPRTA